jgi:hypothetical protein
MEEPIVADPRPPEAYSTVPVSTPTVVPEAEDVQMNGFAWSGDFGLLVAFGQRGEEAVDELIRLRQPAETYLDFTTELRDTDTR